METSQWRVSILRYYQKLKNLLLITFVVISLSEVVNATDFNKAYLMDFFGGNVHTLDMTSDTITQNAITGLNQPNSAALSKDGTKVYITNRGNNKVTVANVNDNSIATEIVVGNNPYGAIVSKDGTKLYVANYSDSTVSIIDTSSNSVLSTVNVCENPVVFTRVDESIYVGCSTSDNTNVQKIDSNNNVSAVANTGGLIGGLAVNIDQSRLYVADRMNNSVSIINTSNNAILNTINVGSGPFGLDINSDGTKLYVANSQGKSVSVIDLSTNSVSTTIDVSNGSSSVYPYAIGIRGNKAYVQSYTNNSNLAIIDLTNNNSVTYKTAPGNLFLVGTFMATTLMQVEASNTPPVVTSTPTTSILEGNSYSYDLTATDSDGDSVNWSVKSGTTLPSWLSFGSGANVTTVAGSGIAGFADGNSTTAMFKYPMGLAIDSSGNIIVADYSDHRIRMIDIYGEVSTLAGTGVAGFNDASAPAAQFYRPAGVAIDSSGNIIITDSYNNKIRKIDTDGEVSTIAGGGSPNVGDFVDGTGTNARFYGPRGVAIDNNGNIIVADYFNNRIRKIDTSGNVTTIAGDGTGGFTDGVGTAAKFNGPTGVAIDSSGNIIVSDYYNHRIRKIDTSGNVTTIVGNGTASFADGNSTTAKFKYPKGVTVDSDGNIIVADQDNHRIRKIDTNGNVTTIAGNGTADFADGVGTEAMFKYPSDVAIDSSGNIIVVDMINYKIRKITNSIKLSGTPTSSDLGIHDVNLTVSDGNGGVTEHNFQITVTGLNNPPVVTSTPSTSGEKNTLYIYELNATDSDGDSINWSAKSGTTLPNWLSLQKNTFVSTFAGSGLSFGSEDGVGTTQARFQNPTDITIGSDGTFYVADSENHLIRKITADGNVTTIAGSGSTGSDNGVGAAASFNRPISVAVDSAGNIYVGDNQNHLIRKITPNGNVTTFAGSGTQDSVDGLGTAASFYDPTDLVFDSLGNLFVSDGSGNKIRKITPDGNVTTLVDIEGTAGGMAIDSNDNLYVADNTHYKIKKITPTGPVTTFVGSGTKGITDGVGPFASFEDSWGIAIDSSDTLYLSNFNTIRKITSDGNVTTIAGSTTSGLVNGTGVDARFNYPSGLVVDRKGDIFVADYMNHRIRKIQSTNTLSGTPTQKGVYDVNLTLSDGTATVAHDFQITVLCEGGNCLPIVSTTPITIATQDSVYSYTINATDEDGDDLNWTIKNGTTLPSWLLLDATSGSSQIVVNDTGILGAYGIALDSDGNLYIADTNNNAIKKFDGTTLSTIIDDESLIYPLAITVDKENNIYFSDYAQLIKKFDGTNTTLIASDLFSFGMITDNDGNLYISDFNNNVIKKFDGTNLTTIVSSGLATPRGLALDKSGNLYIANSGDSTIKKFDGTTLTTVVDSGLSSPSSVAFDINGDLYIADTGDNTIKKFDGTTLTTVVDTGLDEPISIAIDNNNTLYIDNYNSSNIVKVTPSYAKLIGTPTNADVGDHNISLVLSDGTNEVEHNFTITVDNVNDAPTSANINVTIDEDNNKTFALNDFNFTDIDSGDSLESIFITSLPTAGTLTLNDTNVTQNQEINGSDIAALVFSPSLNANGSPYTTFNFKVNDGDVNSSTYTATINVTNVDDIPTLQTISNVTQSEDFEDFNITLISNDVDGDDINYTVESNNTSIATVSIVNGKLVVTPVENAHGTVTIEVNATANGQTVSQSFELEITNLNDTPTLASISNITKSEDFSDFNITITPSDVDLDNLKLTVDMNDSSIISIPTNSTDWISSANYSGGLTLPITAIANKSGVVELNVTVEDPSGEKISELFTISVNPQDDAPVANSMAATVGPNSQNTFDTFTPSYSDIDGNIPNTLRIETLPTVGTFEEFNLSGDGNWTTITTVPFEVAMTDLANYRFNAGNNSGQTTDVNWSIRTTTLWSNVATGVVTIIDPSSNHAPDVNISTSSDSNISGDIITINEDGKTNPIYITFSDDYTPSAFLVGVIDSNNTSKVSLVDGDFNITRISDNNVSVIITPKANVHGDINITMGAFDGDKNGTKSFTLRITSVNDIPIALNFEKTIDEDNNYSFSTLNPTTVYSDTNDSSQNSNETYPDIFQIVSLPQHGRLHLGDNVALVADTNVSLENLGNLVYTPEENNNTDVTFTWRAYDGESWTEIKTATIIINAVDDAPVFTNTFTNININEDGTMNDINLSSFDVENNSVTYSATSSNEDIATVSIVNGKLVVTPKANKSGTVTITVNVIANGKTTTQTFTLSIDSVNDTPTIDTSFSTITLLEDAATTNYDLNVSDIDGDDLNVTVTSSNENLVRVTPNWTHLLNSNGLVNQANYTNLDFNITTVPNANGIATITLTVKDTSGATTTNSFNVNVTAVNDAPTLASLSNVIVYKNSGDKNITVVANDVDGDNLICNVIPVNTQLFSSFDCLDGIVELRIAPNTVGDTDINVTVTDGTLTASRIFNFYILPLEDGTDTAKVNDINVTTENNTTTTSLNIDENLTITTQEDTNGTVTHEIVVAGKEIKATSEINGSKSEFTSNGVHTTYSDSTLNLEVNASLDGKATHILTTNGKTTTATSEFVGAQTVIKKDSNNEVEIETSVAIDLNTTIKVTAREDGTAEHSVIKGTKETKATSTIAGATTKITSSGSVETSAGETSVGGYTLKAKVITDENGKTQTRFVKVNNTNPNDEENLGNTVIPTTPFEAGNNVQIEDISGTLYMKIEAPLSNTNLIIE